MNPNEQLGMAVVVYAVFVAAYKLFLTDLGLWPLKTMAAVIILALAIYTAVQSARSGGYAYR